MKLWNPGDAAKRSKPGQLTTHDLPVVSGRTSRNRETIANAALAVMLRKFSE